MEQLFGFIDLNAGEILHYIVLVIAIAIVLTIFKYPLIWLLAIVLFIVLVVIDSFMHNVIGIK